MPSAQSSLQKEKQKLNFPIVPFFTWKLEFALNTLWDPRRKHSPRDKILGIIEIKQTHKIR